MRLLMLTLGGGLAILIAMAAGRSDALASILQPPFAARVLLGLSSAILGVVLVLRAADRLGTSAEPRDLVRAVRVAFLAVGAFAAAAGWLIGSPVPIVAALIIVGVDVLETSFLLLVTAARPTVVEEQSDVEPSRRDG